MRLMVIDFSMRGMRSATIRNLLRNFARKYRGRSLEIVSYDVVGHDKATSVAVAHFIFGRTERVIVNGGPREYRYLGLIHRPGAAWLGQSVFLLTGERSRELREYLGSKGISYGRLSVRVE